jgi:integrase
MSQREADRKADRFLKDLEDGNVGISKKMRVSAWATEWMETYKKHTVSQKSYEQYKRFVENVIIPQIGGLRLYEVTDVHLQKILNSKAGNSYSNLKQLRDIIKAIFKKARITRLITYDPAESLVMPSYTKGKRRSITKVEREHFLKVAETHYAGLMFKVILYCGLRPGEAVALSWKDLDFDSHMINVVAAMESGTDNMKGPKTAAGVRRIPIPDEVYYDLKERRGESHDPVFVQITTGSRHTKTSRECAWRSLRNDIDKSMGAVYEKRKAKDGKMRRTKVSSVVAPDLVPYCLRHTYCTDLQLKGVPLKTTSYLMGHSDISVTANIYTHITDDTLNEAARLIGVSTSVPNEG